MSIGGDFLRNADVLANHSFFLSTSFVLAFLFYLYIFGDYLKFARGSDKLSWALCLVCQKPDAEISFEEKSCKQADF